MGVPRRKRALLLGLDFQRGAIWGYDGLTGLRGAEMANDVVGRKFALQLIVLLQRNGEEKLIIVSAVERRGCGIYPKFLCRLKGL